MNKKKKKTVVICNQITIYFIKDRPRPDIIPVYILCYFYIRLCLFFLFYILNQVLV